VLGVETGHHILNVEGHHPQPGHVGTLKVRVLGVGMLTRRTDTTSFTTGDHKWLTFG
jgi:hypothetical protein